MRVIYIDVLLFLNFYVTYFLIMGTCCFLHRKISVTKRIVGSIAGTLSSLIIILPQLNLFINILIRIAMSLIITFSAFGFDNIKTFIKSSAVFFIINCLYAGIMLALWLFSAPMGMVYNNGVPYFDIPLMAIILFTSAAYIILRIIRYVLDSKSDLDKKYIIDISTSKGSVSLTAIPDSGNKLTDFFTGLPVIFCDINKCSVLCPPEIIKQLMDNNHDCTALKGVRLIPCSTVSGNMMAVCFKPDKITISDGCNKKEVNALIGFTNQGLNSSGFEAVFNPHLL